MKKRTILYFLFFLALAGLAISIYLLQLNYGNVSSFCDFNAQFSCSGVSESTYSNIFDVPVSLLGVIGYAFFALIPLLSLFRVNFEKIHSYLTVRRVLETYCLMVILSFFFSLYLTYLELRTINVICPLCLISQIIIIIMVFFSYILYNKFDRGLLEE